MAAKIVDEFGTKSWLIGMSKPKKQINSDRMACLKNVRHLHQVGVRIGVAFPVQVLKPIVRVVWLNDEASIFSDKLNRSSPMIRA